MPVIQYEICMHTPLGEKAGTLTVERTGGNLNGWLSILGHREPFRGTVDDSGHCEISGQFITLMRSVPFTAKGQITASSVELSVKGIHNVFELSGSVCPEKEK